MVFGQDDHRQPESYIIGQIPGTFLMQQVPIAPWERMISFNALSLLTDRRQKAAAP
jgi:hypothetical protein